MPSSETVRRDPVAQAFLLLRIGFTVAPILFGLDKFAEVLTDDWTKDLSSEFDLRDFGLLLAALTLFRLASASAGEGSRGPRRL
jgi:hypothetical protein